MFPFTMEEKAEEQRIDSFCQTVLPRQSEARDRAFFENHQRMLKRKHSFDPQILQVVVPGALRVRRPQLCLKPVIGGQSGQNRINYALYREHNWPHLAANVSVTMQACRFPFRTAVRKNCSRTGTTSNSYLGAHGIPSPAAAAPNSS